VLQDFKSALRLFYQAWLKVPKLQMQWDEAGWMLTAIGDTGQQSATGDHLSARLMANHSNT